MMSRCFSYTLPVLHKNAAVADGELLISLCNASEPLERSSPGVPKREGLDYITTIIFRALTRSSKLPIEKQPKKKCRPSKQHNAADKFFRCNIVAATAFR